MKTSFPLRLTAAATSFFTTIVLFNAVASLAEMPKPSAGLQLAQTQATLPR